MHCLTACELWAVQLLQCIASLLVGSGRCNSCNTRPRSLGAVGSATRAMHCLTAWGQWAMQLLQCTVSLPVGSGQCNSCNGRGTLVVGSATLAMGRELLLWTASLPASLPGAVGGGAPAMHCHIACGQWAVQLLQCTASLPRGSGQWNSCNALPHCLGVVGTITPIMHCLTAWGLWAVQLLQCTASLPGGSGQCNSCNALPHHLGAVGSGTPVVHCHTAWGQWAV